MTTDAGNAPQVTEWGAIDGQPVHLYTLQNANGLLLKVTDCGAITVELHTPDRDGRLADIILGYGQLDDYRQPGPYFGAIIGRCANRIAKGSFEIDGKPVQLAINNGPNALHGGLVGFDKKLWNATPLATPKGPAVKFTYDSPDGEEHYPGNLSVTVTYTLTNDDELICEMSATTDQATICNLAQHNYWNLSGHDSGPMTDHVVQIFGDRYTPVDDNTIPTGEFVAVAGTPFDFRTPKPVGQDFAALGGDPGGYDHNYVVNGESLTLRPVANVYDPKSGRAFELTANQPGVQFYTGNYLDSARTGKGGVQYARFHGLCLETQIYPDAIHHPAWPQPVLRPGQTYSHVMVTKFSTR